MKSSAFQVWLLKLDPKVEACKLFLQHLAPINFRRGPRSLRAAPQPRQATRSQWLERCGADKAARLSCWPMILAPAIKPDLRGQLGLLTYVRITQPSQHHAIEERPSIKAILAFDNRAATLSADLVLQRRNPVPDKSARRKHSTTNAMVAPAVPE